MHRITLVLALLLVVPAGALLSQSVQLDSGSRIRVWAPVPPLVRQRGTLTAFGADTLHIHLDRPISPGTAGVVVPLASLTRLDVSRGRHSRGRKALGGAIIGLVGGAILGFATGGNCEGEFLCATPAEDAAIGGGLFAVAGALIGALLPPSEKWVRVPNVGSP